VDLVSTSDLDEGVVDIGGDVNISSGIGGDTGEGVDGRKGIGSSKSNRESSGNDSLSSGGRDSDEGLGSSVGNVHNIGVSRLNNGQSLEILESGGKDLGDSSDVVDSVEGSGVSADVDSVGLGGGNANSSNSVVSDGKDLGGLELTSGVDSKSSQVVSDDQSLAVG